MIRQVAAWIRLVKAVRNGAELKRPTWKAGLHFWGKADAPSLA